jgi:hypothetical protein
MSTWPPLERRALQGQLRVIERGRQLTLQRHLILEHQQLFQLAERHRARGGRRFTVGACAHQGCPRQIHVEDRAVARAEAAVGDSVPCSTSALATSQRIYRVRNEDTSAQTIVIEHPLRPG